MNPRAAERRPAPTLRSRLFLLVAAVAAPLLVVAAAVIYDAHRGEQARAEERLHAQALALALVIDRELGQVKAVLQTLAASSALAEGNFDSFDHELRAASASLHGVGIALVGRDNRQLLNSLWPLGERRTGKLGSDRLLSVFDTGQPATTDLYIGHNSGQPVVALGVPVLLPTPPGGTARVAYEVAAGVRSTRLSAVLEGQRLPSGSIGGVLDRTFHVVARTEQQERYVGSDAIPALREALLTGNSGVLHTPRADGVPSTIVFERAPESGFTVTLAVSDELSLAPLRRALWRTLGLGAVVSGAGLALALWIARRVAIAIGGLAEGHATGGTPARLREVEMAADRLARTAAQRDAAEAALRALAGRLEQEVADRTSALAESEARLRAIFDAQFQYVTLLSPEGRRLDMNRAAMEFRGADREGTIGEPVWDAWWWRDNPAGVDLMKNAVARSAAGEAVRFEMIAMGAGGKQSILDMSFRPVRDVADGSLRMLIAEGHDITDLRALEARLAQTSRLEALGQLAGGVAHDFNNVLQSISGGMSLIARRADDPVAVRRLTEVVSEAIGRGASVTRRLLGFARRDALRAAPVDAADLLGNLREVLHHTLGAAITVTVDAAPAMPPLLADRAQLETVLVNLATNARDAMAGGGTLRLSAVAEAVQAPPAGSGLAPGRYVRLSVIDSGCGMDQATLARAMEPFFTTKPTGKGTGLGLAMARGFAGQSGGALALDSQPGRGTTVTLWLPQAQAAAPPQPPPAAAGRPADRQRRLLLAEDTDLVRETLAAALEALGYEVVRAADGAAAAAALEQESAARDRPFDLLITDLTMPGLSGLEVIRAAHRHWPGLPAILLTGYAGEAIDLAIYDALDGNNVTLLRKPISEARLADRVAALLDGAEALPAQ